MTKKISRVEYDILNALYFVEPFESIIEEVDENVNVIKDVLRQLIDKGYVVPYSFDEEKGDYVRSYMYDSDNMHEYRYLATREGLLYHSNSILEDE